MWSASSSISNSQLLTIRWPCDIRSKRRPGVATTISALLFSFSIWLSCSTPPKIATQLMLVLVVSFSMTEAVCSASSCVGSIIIQRTPLLRR